MNSRACIALMWGCCCLFFAGVIPLCSAPKEGPSGSQQVLRLQVFDEPLVTVGKEPSAEENAALASALEKYAKRARPDDFSGVTLFLKNHPQSSWKASLLTCLGVEYYKAAYYSRALESWSEAWALSRNATDAPGKFLADRAACELAGLYSRLGRMKELEALLKSVERRPFFGGATERINLAREALSIMQHQPEIAFRCGPLALRSIKQASDAKPVADMTAFDAPSTQRGFSLAQVAELSRKSGMHYQMAFRKSDGDFAVPSVVHWKVGHFAGLVRQVGDRYLLEDPTFGNTVWATRQALEAETSGYFLIPPGDLPTGWRGVDAQEGATVWGKGTTTGNDPDQYGCNNQQVSDCGAGNCEGMAGSSVHLMLANLQIKDTPLGYVPPVGPPVQFTVRYNHRDYIQHVNVFPSIFGPKWTHDWEASIRDNPNSPLADVKYVIGGGGARTFTRFDTNTQTFASQQYDQTLLRRIGTNISTSTYEMIFPDGSKHVFGLRTGTSSARLTQVVDAAGNAVTLTWETRPFGQLNLYVLTALTDAIGQVTTISYEHPERLDLITRITDPFGRFATFDYTFFEVNLDQDPEPELRVPILVKITDVLGLESRFEYIVGTDILQRLITPYGAHTFLMGQGGGHAGTTRFVERLYPDGSRDRVEYNQTTNLVASADPPESVPLGMAQTVNSFLHGRNTYYWDRQAAATSYGDYSKARIYHWMHTRSDGVTAGILESAKEPLEGRVWYNYPGQAVISGGATVGDSDLPSHVGRVLEDGQTQLYRFAYNSFGHVTNMVDPIGRTFSYLYDTNDIDLLEMRQIRAGKSELLFRATYNTQHRPLMVVDAAGQTNFFTYNARGQLLTETNPKGETTTYSYDTNGYLVAVDGPLAGTNDVMTVTYDAFGRVRTQTDESGYVLTIDYDAMDRMTRISYPDSTFVQLTHDRLDLAMFQDRAGRQTSFEYDSMRQLIKERDPLGRVTEFNWCRCGDIQSLTDPMGRTTSWLMDVQGRPVAKQYADGSRETYVYERTSSRLHEIIDETGQVTQFSWNRDDTLKSVAYLNAVVPTPGVSFTYDPDYERVVSMVDGTGRTTYSYHPISAIPVLGAGELASVDGPLPNDTITYGYDELGRRVRRAINGVALAMAFDAGGRLVGVTNVLGAFTRGYDGATTRLLSKTLPNGQTEQRSYGNNVRDMLLERITHRVGANPLSEFLYGHDPAAKRISSWSQQAGSQSPALYAFGYDAVNQLRSGTVTNAGSLLNSFAYTYDEAGNRLTERVGGTTNTAAYNALNQISSGTAPTVARTNEWDARNQLVAVNAGSERTEFSYDGLGRRVGVRQLINGIEVSHRRFVWCDREVCEERDATGAVTKRYFPEGAQIASGPAAGNYYYTRDHLGSIRELTDSSGTVRARYAYDPYGRRTRTAGDLDADFGFAGMFWSPEVDLSLTLFRAYDPELGRWLSRDPLDHAEEMEGPNLYAYVGNDPVNAIDPLGLAGSWTDADFEQWIKVFGLGEIVEVEDFGLKQIPASKIRPGGDIMVRPKGELALRTKPKIEPSAPRFRRPYPGPPVRPRISEPPIPRPGPATRLSGVSSASGSVFGAGLTILTMTDCNVAEGIFALVRQGNGGMANKQADKIWRKIKKHL